MTEPVFRTTRNAPLTPSLALARMAADIRGMLDGDRERINRFMLALAKETLK